MTSYIIVAVAAYCLGYFEPLRRWTLGLPMRAYEFVKARWL